MIEAGSAELWFVYNANGGLFNAMADIGHKLFSPDTYSCRLCAITYGLLTEKAGWRAFVASLDADCRFLHRDEFRRLYPDVAIDLPAVCRVRATGLEVCVDAARLNACATLADLEALILERCIGQGRSD